MPFSEPIFLFIFLPATLILYQAASWLTRAPGRPWTCGHVQGADMGLRNGVLLAMSLLFYAWGEVFYVLLMLASIAFNYVCGLFVVAPGGEGRKGVLWTAVVGNLGLLVVFKYANFIVDSIKDAWPAIGLSAPKWTGSFPHIALPIGISFFTFQALSYVIDVYRGTTPSQRSPFNLALYVTLFPQLIAGPIVRYHDVARQITHRIVSAEGFSEGIRRFAIGLAKKVLIANVAGRTADQIFGNVKMPDMYGVPLEQLTPGLAWLAVICYTVQIYFDFSAYSDMAIGLGRMFGFRFLENFNYPYISRSITEFWRRWHISLSNWFRDYLYIPLGGNRRGALRTYANLVIVFVLCGLWHGASWTFLIWGAYHGAFLVIERLGLGKALKAMPRALQHGYLMLAAMGGWVLFRADTGFGPGGEVTWTAWEQARAYFMAMFGLAGGDGQAHNVRYYLTGNLTVVLIIAAIFATPVLPAAIRLFERSRRRLAPATAKTMHLSGLWLETAAIACLLIASAMALAANSYSPFIYFRF